MTTEWLWVVVVASGLATFVWRALGVVVVRRIDPRGAFFQWITCVSYAMVAGLIFRMLILPESELAEITRQLGVDYQLVTDETSMVVLTDDAFLSRGIERRNRDRVARERQAQSQRASQPVKSYRADKSQPMFPGNAPRPGSGAGAIDPFTAALALALGGAGAMAARRKRERR